jgi:hypothetical protein
VLALGFAYWDLRPRIEVVAVSTLLPNLPNASWLRTIDGLKGEAPYVTFAVKNVSPLPLSKVRSQCWVPYEQFNEEYELGLKRTGDVVSGDSPVVASLGDGDQETFSCILGPLEPQPGAPEMRITYAEAEVDVKYTFLLIPLVKHFKFATQKNQSGELEWRGEPLNYTLDTRAPKIR